jgi:transposase
MDTAFPYAEEFQDIAHQAALDLFNQKIECFFYDATTLYFESVIQDEIRDFGYSKDGKFNQVQILFCLLVTEKGLPVGYEIFPGSTQEIKTLEKAIKNLSCKFKVEKATIVCDRGMLSKDNLEFAEKNGKMFYIVGEKLRKLPAKYHDKILDISTYESKGGICHKELEHPYRPGARLLLFFSEQRARKDKNDRDRLLSKLLKKINKKKHATPKDFVSNRGIKKFVSINGGSIQLNDEQIAKEEEWDGIFGIVTNHPQLTTEEVLGQYRGLWQVEESFRVSKNDLRMRPIFHWSPDRIKTHVLICFIALVLERHLEQILKKRRKPLTHINIHDALSLCKKIIFQEGGTHRLFQMSSNKPDEAKVIYKTLGLNWRSSTIELPNPGQNVVPSSHSVIPQVYGIIGNHMTNC